MTYRFGHARNLTNSIHHPLVTEARQTCIACPDQHEGKLTTGESFYFRYRHGHASLTIDTRDRTVGMAFGDGNQGIFTCDAERDGVFAILMRGLGMSTPDVTDQQPIEPSEIIAAPTPKMRGRFSLFDTPDGGLHIAYREDGEQEDQHFEVPAHVLKLAKMVSEGTITNPMELLKVFRGE